MSSLKSKIGMLTSHIGIAASAAVLLLAGTARATITSPTEINNLRLWLDASDASTVVLTGGKVSQWSDKSGGGRHAVQTLDASRPVPFTRTTWPLWSVIQFSSQNLVVGTANQAIPATDSFTIFAVSTAGAGFGRKDTIGMGNWSVDSRSVVLETGGAAQYNTTASPYLLRRADRMPAARAEC